MMRPVYEAAARARPGMIAIDDGWWTVLSPREEGRGRAAVLRRPRGPRRGSGRLCDLQGLAEWPHGVASNELSVESMIIASPEATAALWRHFLDIDLVATVKAWGRPAVDPFRSFESHGDSSSPSRTDLGAPHRHSRLADRSFLFVRRWTGGRRARCVPPGDVGAVRAGRRGRQGQVCIHRRRARSLGLRGGGARGRLPRADRRSAASPGSASAGAEPTTRSRRQTRFFARQTVALVRVKSSEYTRAG